MAALPLQVLRSGSENPLPERARLQKRPRKLPSFKRKMNGRSLWRRDGRGGLHSIVDSAIL